ncbi:hypothetical protein [Thiothrix winogradskyi]|uniref:DUF4342 domain-containing protein n=1 Tax=Thiothrix winogradskyi TaxID=96472 RepID=A0ABY3T3P2_9GAMM|nr:hypothetical protein [Thiothrix winogradskyi]UJS26005.1 hypothetical protein L2Y54_08150 [Thiothrix winogradskyi]
MKIISGTFGVKGDAFISKDRKLVVNAAKKAIYSNNQITSINTSVEKERKFAVIGFILGMIIFVPIIGFIFGPIGAIAMLIILVILGFYNDENNIVDVCFSDGESIKLNCTNRMIKNLIQFKENS